MDKEKALKIWLPVIADGVKDLPECKESLEMATEALKNQKTGHWIEIDDYPHEDFECDCCGGKVYGTEEPYEEYKYCPNCGAKMAESEDKE